MNFLKNPKTKAFLATVAVASVTFLLLSGVIYLAKNWPDQTFTFILASGIAIYTMAVYENFLQKYKNNQEDGTGTN